MARNVFFENFDNFAEQELLNSLSVEALSIYGHTIYYCPRTIIAKDDIYGEDPVSEYNMAYEFEVYIKSYDSYEGDGTFLSKFNLEIRDSITFSMVRSTFWNELGDTIGQVRPLEGDLIYSPMMKRVFVIKYINNTPTFYQMGTLQSWDVVCEVWEYSSEKLRTGVLEIDEIEVKYSTNVNNSNILSDDILGLTDENGVLIEMEPFDFDEQNTDTYADNDEINAENIKDGIVQWDSNNPFGGS